MRYEAHDYQKYATDFILSHPIAAVFLEMGLGKSVITLTALFELCLDSFLVRKVLVIAPLRVARDTWPAEIKKWDHLKGLAYSVAVGTETERKAALMQRASVYIINRENVDWLIEKSGIPFDFDMVVIDELSSFKSWQAKRFKSLLKARPSVKRIVGLTGTPSSNGLMDLWAEFRLLDLGQRLGRYISHYRNAYFTPDKRNGQVIFSYKPLPGAEERIYERISDITISMKSCDYLNIRLGIQFRNQQGKVKVNHNRFLGYTKDADGKLVIVPEEAEIVRRIYAEYMDGASFLQIKRGLEADGILNGAHNTRWYESNIRQILTNEKYIGDALLQKTYTVSILEKKRSVNNGNLPKYYVEGSHEAIIDKDVFLRVQAEIARRANILSDGKKRVYSGRYALSSIVFCGHCGDIYRRIKWNNRGCKSTVWRCVSRVEKKTSGIDCPARTIKEEDLQAAVVTAVNDAWSRKDAVLPLLKENIRSVLGTDTDGRISKIDEVIRSRQAELLDVGKDEGRIDSIGDEIMRLREERQDILTEAAIKQETQNRMEDMAVFLDNQTEAVTEYSEALVRRLIEKITVYDEKLTVEFKSGFSTDVEM